MGPTWVLSAPSGPHVGPMNLATRDYTDAQSDGTTCETLQGFNDGDRIPFVIVLMAYVGFKWYYSPWTSYQIRKIAGCACARNAGNVFPRRRFQSKPLVSDPGMHHGTCVTHVPWCMSGSLTCGDGENVPGIPGACAPAILRIWQEAHAVTVNILVHVRRPMCWLFYMWCSQKHALV